MELKPLDWLLVVALTAVSLLVGGSLLLPDVCGVFHDDAIYAVTAKALALNKGYCLINLPGSPLQTKYPILYPAILSVIWKLCPNFPENLLPMKWLSIVLAALSIGFSYLYLVRWGYASRPAAFSGALLCAFASWFWYCSTLTQTEAPFAFLLVCAFWCLERQIRQSKTSPSSEFFIGIVLALPFLCRVLGAMIIPVAFWLLYRARRRLRFIILGMAAAAGPWILFVLMSYRAVVSNPTERYYTDYFGWWTQLGQDFVGIFFFNFCLAITQSSILVFSGLHMLFIRYLGNGYLFAAALLGAVMWWYLWKFRIQERVLPLFLTLYVSLLLVWPGAPGRFFVPLLALMAGLLIAGIYTLTDKIFKNKIGFWLCTAAIAIAVSANVVDIRQKVIWDKKHGFPSIPFDRQLTAYWSSYQDLFSWLRTHSTANTIGASEFDTMVALYTDIKCIRPIQNQAIVPGDNGVKKPMCTVSELLSKLNYYKVDYVIGLPVPGFPEEKPLNDLLETIRQEHPLFLKRVYTGTDQRFFVDQCIYPTNLDL